MEALFLTFDVICVILLLRNVLRVIKSENPKELGMFGYDETHSVDLSLKNRNGVR